MSLEVEKSEKKSEQKTELQRDTQKVVDQFINYYYKILNEKNFEELLKFYKQYTEINFEGIIYRGEELKKLFYLLSTNNIIYQMNSMDYLMSGNHRINILITGTIQIGEIIKNFSEYLHFGTCKDKKTNEYGYWIQSSIFRSI